MRTFRCRSHRALAVVALRTPPLVRPACIQASSPAAHCLSAVLHISPVVASAFVGWPHRCAALGNTVGKLGLIGLYNRFFLTRHLSDYAAKLGPEVTLRIVNAHLEAFSSESQDRAMDGTMPTATLATFSCVLCIRR